jgi:hypothetical protein
MTDYTITGFPAIFDNPVTFYKDISIAGNLTGTTLGLSGNATVGGTLSTNTVTTVAGKPILQSTGSILQVVQTLKTDSFTTTSTSPVDITGLSVSITPTSSSSKILVISHVPFAKDGTGSDAWIRLMRGSTPIGNGNGGYFMQAAGQYGLDPVTGTRMYLDSPATTSATTYKVQAWTSVDTVYVGTRRLNDFILGCDITVMEISG